MVQGLAFLSKKSWHTKNMANQEKVWLAEERKRAEDLKTAELAKQIQQEREEAELEEMTGQTKRKRDRGIDWMYEQGQGELARQDAQKQAEEYLLGKEFVPAAVANKGDLKNAEGTNNEGVHAAVVAASEKMAAAEAPTTEPSVQDRNEAFRMRLEDPMFAVTKRAAEQQQKYDKKKELYERVVGGVAVDVVNSSREHNKKKKRKRDREERRARKRERKDERRRRHHHRRSNSLSDSDDSEAGCREKSRRRSRKSPSRSPSYDRRPREKAKRSHSHWNRRHRQSKSRSPVASRSRSPDRHNKYRGRSRSPSWDPQPSGHPDRYHHDRHRKERDIGRNHHRSRRERYDSSDQNQKQPGINTSLPKSPPLPRSETLTKKDEYGLQSGGVSSNNASTAGTSRLGPDRKLLQQKRQERQEERRRVHETATSRRRRTAEEREQAIRDMEMDARRREQNQRESRTRKEKEEEEDAPSRGRSAAFLQEVQHVASSISMSERLQQNRNNNQRRTESFL